MTSLEVLSSQTYADLLIRTRRSRLSPCPGLSLCPHRCLSHLARHWPATRRDLLLRRSFHATGQACTCAGWRPFLPPVGDRWWPGFSGRSGTHVARADYQRPWSSQSGHARSRSAICRCWCSLRACRHGEGRGIVRAESSVLGAANLSQTAGMKPCVYAPARHRHHRTSTDSARPVRRVRVAVADA